MSAHNFDHGTASRYERGVYIAQYGGPQGQGGVYIDASLAVLPVTTSTMDEIEKLMEDPYNDTYTIIALHQTKGRGSKAHVRWESGKGNLMFSRKMRILANEHGQEMEMIAACAVAEIVQELLPLNDVRVKHPNDVRVDGKKICGCLVYPKYDSRHHIGKARVINLGVGVNLAEAPDTTQETTSLAAQGCSIGIAAFMHKFDGVFAEILATYRTTKDFNTVLRRMGFLSIDSDELVLYDHGDNIKTRGNYAGFECMADTNYLKLRDGRMFALRSFTLKNGARRNACVYQRNSEASVAVHG